jgi:membrane protease subunit (stomatin/prohibitin family)
MGLLNKIRGEFVDIIEWTEPAESQILAYRFPRLGNEIKYGARLTVREGQAGVFVNEGQVADVFPPGMHTLETQNMPILTTLQGWKYGFQSPFKAEVYFVATRQWTDQKWGTQNPVMMRDTEFGPVRIRAFGTYAFRVADPKVFLQQLVATDPAFEAYEVVNQLRNAIVSRFVDVLAQARIPVLDLAGNYDRLSQLALDRIAPDLATMGMALTRFYVENISLPVEVEQAVDRRTRMGVIGDVAEYTRFQTADAIRDAAQNPGGIAGIGAGLGAAVAIGQQMGAAVGATAPVIPPPLPSSIAYHVAINGSPAGPFDLATLSAKAREGVLTRDTLVWKQGMANWIAAEAVAELQPLLIAGPPPLPRT